MSTFIERLTAAAAGSDRGMLAGDPHQLTLHTWAQIHDDAKAVAAALIHRGVPRGSAIAILAAEAPAAAAAAQGAWLAGSSVTMLHQPTARTDLANRRQRHRAAAAEQWYDRSFQGSRQTRRQVLADRYARGELAAADVN